MTDLFLVTRTDGRALRVTARGEVDMANYEDLAAATHAAIASGGVDAVVVDLCQVSFMDSSGIRTLVLEQEHARSHGVDYRVANPSVPVRRVLEITGLLSTLTTDAPQVEA